MSDKKRVLQGKITDKIQAEIDGAVGWLTFNDPEKHNAVSVEMWEAVPDVLELFSADPDIRVIVLTGAGQKAFVSGANISQFDDLRTGEEIVKRYESAAESAMESIYRCTKPTIARIDGYCIGGGLNIALCCDIRVASDVSTFSIPAGRLGLGYRVSALRNLVNCVGAAHALEIFLGARKYSADEAQSRGLVAESVPADQLDECLGKMTRAIAQNAPLTLAAGKAMIRQLSEIPGHVDLEKMNELVLQCFRSSDYAEGKRAFAEKRRPVFEGK